MQEDKSFILEVYVVNSPLVLSNWLSVADLVIIVLESSRDDIARNLDYALSV